MIPYTSSITPFYFEVGDHRVIIIDFPMKLLTGDEFVLMAKSKIKRIISSQLQSVENYISISKELFNHYKIADKLDKLYEEWNLFFTEEQERKLNALDLEITNLLIGAKKKYHK